LSFELKCDGHYTTFGSRSCVAVTSNGQNLRIFEDGRIEVHCLFGLIIEPQERRDFLETFLHMAFFLTSLLAAAFLSDISLSLFSAFGHVPSKNFKNSSLVSISTVTVDTPLSSLIV